MTATDQMHPADGELHLDPPGPGVWQRDEDHWPRPVPRSYTEIYPGAIVPYVKEWTRRYGLLLDYFQPAFPQGFGYGRIRAVGEPERGGGPPPKPVFKLLLRVHPELRARRRAAARALDERLWLVDLDEWDRSAKPAVLAENRANATVDRSELDDEALVEHVDACRETLRRFIGLHHRFNGGMVATGLLMVAVREWTGDPGIALHLLDGSSPISSGRSEELDRLAAAVRDDPQARATLEGGDPAGDVLERLEAAGGAVGTAYREYRLVVGSRLVGDSIEHGNPTLAELPELMLRTIRTAVEDEGLAPVDEGALADRVADVRQQVPAEQRAEFDRLLDDARRTYRMRDERSVYADVWAAGVFRQALLELGRRLAAGGRLTEPVHLIEATSDEVTALATGAGGPAPEELAQRARFRAEHANAVTPAALGGEPSPPPPVELLPDALRQVNAAVLIQMADFLARPGRRSAPDVVEGTPGSAGSYRGRARVVRGPEELDRIQPGDVLVARSTSESFNIVLPLLGAILTDRGGVTSHAAIVSREAGIPCVVGTGDATTRIADGDLVEVDGRTGTVTLLPA